MNEKKGCSKMGFGHMKWMLLLAVAAVAVSFALPSMPWIPPMILLLCPLMMIGMMLFMHQGHGSEAHSCCKTSQEKADSEPKSSQSSHNV